MIIEGLYTVIFGVLDFILEMLPFSDMNFSTSPLQTGIDILKSITYFLPLETVYDILELIMCIMLFRIAVAIIKTIWQLLPLV